MSSNTENTEAKLAAYVDGQLDLTELAQIEQYLRANPDHQHLLTDMIAQRQAMRDLPREKAPPDIYDAMQAQLERSILLDDTGNAAPPPVRHSRRSQVFAIAAIAPLAIGLAAVLYFALPSSRPNPIEIAATGPATTSRAPESTTNAASTESAPLATAIAAPAALGGQLATTPQPDSDHLVLLVSTNSPSQANQQVAAFLDANNIHWDSLPSLQPSGSVKAEISDATASDNRAELKVQTAPATEKSDQTVTSYFAKKSELAKDQVGQQFIIARQMTRSQVAELTDTLSTDHGSQRARLLESNPSTTQPEQSAADRLLGVPAPTTQSDQELPAARRSFAAALSPATPTTQLAGESAPPATSPATTEPDQAVDVIILVENQPAISIPTTAPTTTPSATQPAQP